MIVNIKVGTHPAERMIVGETLMCSPMDYRGVDTPSIGGLIVASSCDTDQHKRAEMIVRGIKVVGDSCAIFHRVNVTVPERAVLRSIHYSRLGVV